MSQNHTTRRSLLIAFSIAAMAVSARREVDIRMQIAKDYDQGISHLTSGKVDFSRFGPASYIEAKKMNNKIEILAVESKDGAKVFYGVIATESSSPIKTIEDVRNKSFAFGDEGSTIGRFLSQLYLQQNGIRANDLSKYEYLGRHDKVGTAVGAGDFAAGALNESTFKKLIDAGEPLRAVAKFPNVTKPWIARSGLDPVIYEALQLSLLEIRNERALKGLKIHGFLKGDDRDYAVIREAMDFNSLFFEEPKSTESDVETAVISNVAPIQENLPNTSNAVEEATETLANNLSNNLASHASNVTATPNGVKKMEVIAAAKNALIEQRNLKPEPTAAAAMPANPDAEALAHIQQVNAQNADIAKATYGALGTPIATDVNTHKLTGNAPSNYAVNGNNLTVNITLPQQLMSQSTSQNITINLSFPAGKASISQVNQ